ncbi:MAG: metallophosphoesterase [Deltaproteobacteria bacterium]|nr:metallophosphoesterase [Deltaproteobacteria bacterium]MBW2071586.1 metallophosphoesterase [Deltaproteobacteria bacterium]
MVWFIIFVGGLLLIYGYVGWRTIAATESRPHWKPLWWAILIFFFLLPPATIILKLHGSKVVSTELLAWLSYISLGFFTLLFIHLFVRDLFLVAASIGRGCKALLRRHGKGRAISSGVPNQLRRQFLLYSTNLGILGFTGALTGYGLYEARRQPRTVHIKVPLDNLPADLEGLRIVQITDVHVSLTIGRAFVQSIVDAVNRLTPDLIAFTGDLADGSVADLRDDVAPLAELSAPYGSFFVTGNHEYYSGVEPWVEELDRLGFTVLINEHQILGRGKDRFVVAGVTDYSARHFLSEHISSPKTALAGVPSDLVKILLAHQPRSVFAAAREGVDLQISGHTHGGQYYPWNFLVGLSQPYISGLHLHDSTYIYVSRGAGYWGPPLRLAAPSEIALITLTGSGRVST